MKSTKVKSAKKTRSYNNASREKKVDLNKQKIIEAYVDLLVANSGQDVTLQVLAKKTKISLRTLFRFFGDKETLNQEIETYLGQYLGSISSEIAKMNTSAYAEFSFETFEQYEKLFKAYLYTGFGQQSRRILRRKFYELLVGKIVHEVAVAKNMTPENVTSQYINKIRFVANLISAQTWNDLKESYGLSGKESGPIANWAVESLLKSL